MTSEEHSQARPGRCNLCLIFYFIFWHNLFEKTFFFLSRTWYKYIVPGLMS